MCALGKVLYFTYLPLCFVCFVCDAQSMDFHVASKAFVGALAYTAHLKFLSNIRIFNGANKLKRVALQRT